MRAEKSIIITSGDTASDTVVIQLLDSIKNTGIQLGKSFCKGTSIIIIANDKYYH